MSLEEYNLKILILWGSGEHSRGKIRPLQEKLEKKIQWKIKWLLLPSSIPNTVRYHGQKKQAMILRILCLGIGIDAQIAGLFAIELFLTRASAQEEVWQEWLHLMMVKDLPDNSVERSWHL